MDFNLLVKIFLEKDYIFYYIILNLKKKKKKMELVFKYYLFFLEMYECLNIDTGLF